MNLGELGCGRGETIHSLVVTIKEKDIFRDPKSLLLKTTLRNCKYNKIQGIPTNLNVNKWRFYLDGGEIF